MMRAHRSARIVACLCAIFMLLTAGCEREQTRKSPENAPRKDDFTKKEKTVTDENPVVVIETSKGDLKVELWADRAPVTVENFLDYVEDDFYAGTLFHRVIPGFMIQGGGLDKDMQKKPTAEPIENEASADKKNERGTLAMARTGKVDSATSQFFINLSDNEFLDHTGETPDEYGYAVFGEVIEGMDVVDEIAAVETTRRKGRKDVPTEPVIIQGVRRVEQ